MSNLQRIGFVFILPLLIFATQAVAAETPETKPETTVMSSALPEPVGRVVWVKGTFTAIMPNKEKRELQKTSLIYLHDTLMTDANTQAQIVFTDNSLMTFRQSTNFYIDQYAYKPQSKPGSVGKYIMHLFEGGFRTITGLVAKANPTDYQINTPVATIGVRGTDYVVYVHNGEMYVGYYSGSPCVQDKKGILCLDNATPYAHVASPGAAPVPVSEQPAVFNQKLEILPATIAPFVPPGGGSGGSTTGGTVSSFCIQ